MAINVQRIPRGLLQLLNAVSSGRNPEGMEETVRGILDMTPFYQFSQLTTQQVSTGASAAPTGSVTVPDNQWWLLIRVSFVVVPGGAGNAHVVTDIEIANATGALGGLFVKVASAEVNRAAATTSPVIASYAPEKPMILAPGSVIGGRTENAIDAASTGFLRMHVGVLG